MNVLLIKNCLTKVLLIGTLFLTVQSYALDDNKYGMYPKEWKKVDSLESKGLYNMALEEVHSIFLKATKEKAHNQVIKAVIYELKYNSYLVEDDYVLGIAKIAGLIDEAPSPSKEILHSLLAEVYWGYYSSNQWKFSNRTAVVEVDLADIRTWDLNKIRAKVVEHYTLSLNNASISQEKEIEEFSLIISSGSDNNEIQPTLYDFLGHRALNYFTTNNFSGTNAADAFFIDEPAYFFSNSSFLKLNKATKDSLNTRFLSLKTLRALTVFHVQKGNLKPAFYLEMQRIKYVNTHATLSSKTELYINALQRMADAYKVNDFASEAWYELAVIHNSKGAVYNHLGDTSAVYERKKAMEICQKTVAMYPSAFGSEQCKNLISQIETKSIALTAEDVIIPNQVSKFLLNYRNIDKAHFKIVKFDYDKIERGKLYGEKLYRELRRKKGVYEEITQLKNPKDYNGHSVELEIPALEKGFYYLVCSTDGNFNEDKGGYACIPLCVTELAFQTRVIGNDVEVMVSNRETGHPVVDATVGVTYRIYNYKSNKYEYNKLGDYITDAKGRVTFEIYKDLNNYDIIIKQGDDVFDPHYNIYAYKDYNGRTTTTVTQLFTDRKMYRPGQTIFFKGITYRADGKDRKLQKNSISEVILYDVNHQEIARQKVTTNQFGSFEGEFKAPFGVLTGQMQITNNTGSTSFRVEEYKRPKFNVTMQPIEGEFELNDSITGVGVAKAFAGNLLDGAAVSYRVTRTTNYNRGYWWIWQPPVAPVEISNGTTLTDEKGEFNVTFKALPNKEVSAKTLPIFTYTIYADVTDINGETHSTSSTILVGYQSLQLGNNIQDNMNTNNSFELMVSTTNLNGQPIDATGTVIIEKLTMPNQAYVDRKWSRPDMQNWTKAEFQKRFPNEEYQAENQQQNWKTEAAVFNEKFDTKDTNLIVISDYNNWKPGAYKYTATAKDKNGIEVKDIQYFTVFSASSNAPATNDLLWIKPLKTTAEPGEKVTILLGSMAENLLVSYDTEANGKLLESKNIVINKAQKQLEFKIEEVYRGNFTIHFTTMRHNRHISRSITINVPYTNKQLDLSFATFRNKLLPGSAEEWILTIKNRGGKKEQAELMATLYDASLDELYTPNSFYMNIYQTFYGRRAWRAPEGMTVTNGNNLNYYWNSYPGVRYRSYPALKYFGWNSYYYAGRYGDLEAISVSGSSTKRSFRLGNGRVDKAENEAVFDDSEELMSSIQLRDNAAPSLAANSPEGKQSPVAAPEQDNNNLNEVAARSNFNETAFFYPQLTTDKQGNVSIKFTIPESLTKWRFLGLAHTKDLKIGTISEEVITQKELMVVPNVPRFLREGDAITIAAKISNISEEDLVGQAQLFLYDPFTDELIESEFNLENAVVSFAAEKGRSSVVSWTIDVPYTQSAVKYKIVARAGNFSDGEENVLPILSNRMLVTESLPLPIRGKEQKTFNFQKLQNSGGSKTLKHHRYTLEFTSNPAWYAIQAMPYMMEYPHECAEQTFTRYYSNAIASHIMNSNPKVKKVIEDWGANSPEAFLSNLQKNQELKAVMLEETPWVLDAKNEEASKRNLAVLLDMERMSGELDKALSKTMKAQTSNGGWPWFPGMKESRYITQHIITGMGHLDHLGIKDVKENGAVWNMIAKGIDYLDRAIVEDLKYVKKYDPDYKENQHIGYTQIQYLYARSYFPELGFNLKTKEAIKYYQAQAEKYWLTFNIYGEGMLALAANRFEMKELANDITKSLKDRSIQHEEFGMYWKDYQIGYSWYQAPIETQALMIELFDEVTDDQVVVEELKIWLLKQKQTTNWKTTKQTTEAVYALLLKGTDLLANDDLVQIEVGGKPIEYIANPDDNNPYQVKSQAGTGYFKTAWGADEVKLAMGEIKVKKSSTGVAWGAAYWQYFEDLDKITFAETNLKLKKQLFIVDITDQGEQLKPITEKNTLAVGQKIRVRVELRTDRNLEYVHMKDMRASGFEPINVLSRYYYQDGLGYYQATKDAATHFFFDYIPKGTYVFEYDLRVQHQGDFSNGITTIQCMYAPEFTSHSEGIRVSVK